MPTCTHRCIYPQNRSGEPIINPNGKYLVCLNLNGTKRKVGAEGSWVVEQLVVYALFSSSFHR